MYNINERFELISEELNSLMEQYNSTLQDKQKIDQMLQALMTEIIRRQAVLQELKPYIEDANEKDNQAEKPNYVVKFPKNKKDSQEK